MTARRSAKRIASALLSLVPALLFLTLSSAFAARNRGDAPALVRSPATEVKMTDDLSALRRSALKTVAEAEVRPGGKLAGQTNSTPYRLHAPGGSYPSFWVRDAAMMLGADFISAEEVAGWIRLVASTQPGPEGIRMKHGLFAPGYSIPDHVNLNGKAVWYPGTGSDGDDQGDGRFGFLPPADDAFFFIGMATEHVRLTGKDSILKETVSTGWGAHPVLEVLDRAFDSVEADPKTELVVCSAEKEKSRVDWGFCDTVRKTGLALMPSLLRYRAALDLAKLHADRAARRRYQRIAARIRRSLAEKLFVSTGPGEGMLLSATGTGRKLDVWATAFAVSIGALGRERTIEAAKGLLSLVKSGGIARDGQYASMPEKGDLGGHWEECLAAPGTYQNGAYWGTPSGWVIDAISKVDPDAARRELHALVAFDAAHESEGAPWECFNPEIGHRQNPRYVATVALPYVVLSKNPLFAARGR